MPLEVKIDREDFKQRLEARIAGDPYLANIANSLTKSKTGRATKIATLNESRQALLMKRSERIAAMHRIRAEATALRAKADTLKDKIYRLRPEKKTRHEKCLERLVTKRKKHLKKLVGARIALETARKIRKELAL